MIKSMSKIKIMKMIKSKRKIKSKILGGGAEAMAASLVDIKRFIPGRKEPTGKVFDLIGGG